MKVPIIAKLVTLAMNKFAIMDFLGMGVELEVRASPPSASPHLTATPAHYYFRYYSDNGVIALCATVLSHHTRDIPQGMQLMNSIP